MLNDKSLLTQEEVENRVGASTTGIWKWVKAGRFPQPIKPGGLRGKKYYRIEDIESFERGEYDTKDKAEK